MDHARIGGTLLNQKFTPQLLQDESGLDKLVQLIRAYFKLDGHHVQLNVVDAATLRAAQANPEQYRDQRSASSAVNFLFISGLSGLGGSTCT
jgi:pyruvate-formate lyase